MAEIQIVFVNDLYTEVISHEVVNSVVLTESQQFDVVLTEQSFTILSSGTQGPAGPPGTSGAQSLIIIAGEDLIKHRAIIAVGGQAFHADKDTLTDKQKVIGIVSENFLLGENSIIYIAGAMIDSNWNFSDGLVYINTDGQLTQTLPTTGFLMQIGVAVTSNTFIIDIDAVDIAYNATLDGGAY